MRLLTPSRKDTALKLLMHVFKDDLHLESLLFSVGLKKRVLLGEIKPSEVNNAEFILSIGATSGQGGQTGSTSRFEVT